MCYMTPNIHSLGFGEIKLKSLVTQPKMLCVSAADVSPPSSTLSRNNHSVRIQPSLIAPGPRGAFREARIIISQSAFLSIELGWKSHYSYYNSKVFSIVHGKVLCSDSVAENFKLPNILGNKILFPEFTGCWFSENNVFTPQKFFFSFTLLQI